MSDEWEGWIEHLSEVDVAAAEHSVRLQNLQWLRWKRRKRRKV